MWLSNEIWTQTDKQMSSLFLTPILQTFKFGKKLHIAMSLESYDLTSIASIEDEFDIKVDTSKL